jgi:release factor glutamine methyltransferase
MTVDHAYRQLVAELQEIYDRQEAQNIAAYIITHETGLDHSSRIIHKDRLLTLQQQEKIAGYTSQLLLHAPLQYVLQEAWFAGMKFYVDAHVLIPRPETEELVEWVVESQKLKVKSEKEEENPTSIIPNPQSLIPAPRILDIGTGSGCIAIALRKKLPSADVYAIDIAADSLSVARRNAEALEAPVHFIQQDILDEAQWQQLPMCNLIVSNPPYIRQQEATEMQANVLQFEPHRALFVNDEQPLLFYEAIARLALHKMDKQGWLYFEINEALGAEVQSLLISSGFIHVEVKQDLQGKDRMVRAQLI